MPMYIITISTMRTLSTLKSAGGHKYWVHQSIIHNVIIQTMCHYDTTTVTLQSASIMVYLTVPNRVSV